MIAQQPTIARNKEARFSRANQSSAYNKLFPDARVVAGSAHVESYRLATTAAVRRRESSDFQIVRIQRLINFELNPGVDAILEPDDDGFIARAIDLPLYGYGDDMIEAITVLKREIESLYRELIA